MRGLRNLRRGWGRRNRRRGGAQDVHLGHGLLGEDAVRELGDEILVDPAGFFDFALVLEDIGLGEDGQRGAVAVGIFCGDFLVSCEIASSGLPWASRVSANAQVAGMGQGVGGIFVQEGLEDLHGVVVFVFVAELSREDERGIAGGDGAGVFVDDLAVIILGRGLGEGGAGGGDEAGSGCTRRCRKWRGPEG